MANAVVGPHEVVFMRGGCASMGQRLYVNEVVLNCGPVPSKTRGRIPVSGKTWLKEVIPVEEVLVISKAMGVSEAERVLKGVSLPVFNARICNWAVYQGAKEGGV